MIREVDIIFVIIEECVFDVNEGSLTSGDIVVRTDTNDEELSDETLDVSLIEESVLGLVDLGGIEGLFEEVDDVLDLHGFITVNN
jgi:hypothetical protein